MCPTLCLIMQQFTDEYLHRKDDKVDESCKIDAEKVLIFGVLIENTYWKKTDEYRL